MTVASFTQGTVMRTGAEENCFILESKLCGFSPQANYTDRATATCRRS
jgi:hypothetical protein